MERPALPRQLLRRGIDRDDDGVEIRPVDINHSDWDCTLFELLKAYGARVEIIPDTGHFTQLEAPQRVNQLIAEFCR